jgi:S1-C subfamily serine protease
MINRTRVPKLFLIVFAFFSLLLFTACGTQQAKTLDPPKIDEYNKPGTVYIETIWSADITVPNLAFNETAMYNKIAPMVLAGQLTNEDQITTAIINEFLANPALYIIPGAGTQSMPVETGGSGTGFIITPDGYVVTNAHVVKMSDAEMKESMALIGLADIVKNDISTLETALGITVNDDQYNRLAEAAATIYAQYLTMSNQTSASQLYMGVAVPGLGTVQKGMPCEIVKAGETSPGKDVAILKINANNLPTVQLGDDTAVKDGEQAIALGYPGVATFNPLIKKSEENIKPSLTVGSISGRKTMQGGWEVLQTDTAITHGNSGGPLFNNKGEVIGITTFGSVQQNATTGATEEVQGFNFAIPSTVIKQFLSESNITPTEGQLMKTYREGVDLFFDEHYSAAKEKFKQVSDSNAAFPYVTDQISVCTAKINDGLDKSTFPIPMWLIIILVIIVLGVAGAVIFYVLKGNKAKKPSAVPPVTPSPVAPQPTPPAAPSPVAPEPTPPAAPEPAPAPEEATTEMPKPAAPEPEEDTTGETAGSEEQPHFCANCGHSIPEDAKFCPNCSKPVKH